MRKGVKKGSKILITSLLKKASKQGNQGSSGTLREARRLGEARPGPLLNGAYPRFSKSYFHKYYENFVKKGIV